ncbi:hypothetical protein N0V88_007662 [Collariella sp. IMI 366227]|nr:hypothetical protein N0V88_007662 [Collariella sp. IMI 366227]
MPEPGYFDFSINLRQAGKTVLIAGASRGVGFAIARNFVKASAAHIIITVRRPHVLAEAAAQLRIEANGTGTVISSYASDVSNLQQAEKL